MARALGVAHFVPYTFAALLALLSMHGVALPAGEAAPTVCVCRVATQEQLSPQTLVPHRGNRRPPLTAGYVSRVMPEPYAAVLFQRPPPFA